MRKEINESDLKKVTGGSIVFNGDCTTCGYDRNDEYRVVDFDNALSYMLDHVQNMDERDILQHCLDMGYIERL